MSPTGPICFQIIHEYIQKLHELFHPWSESSPINKTSEEWIKIHSFVERLKSSNIHRSLACVNYHLIKGEFS